MFLGRNSDSCRGRWIGQKWLSNIWNAPTSHGASFETEIRESACTPIPFVINESVHFITKYNSLQNNKKWRMDISQSSCHFHIYFYPIQTGSFFHISCSWEGDLSISVEHVIYKCIRFSSQRMNVFHMFSWNSDAPNLPVTSRWLWDTSNILC